MIIVLLWIIDVFILWSWFASLPVRTALHPQQRMTMLNGASGIPIDCLGVLGYLFSEIR